MCGIDVCDFYLLWYTGIMKERITIYLQTIPASSAQSTNHRNPLSDLRAGYQCARSGERQYRHSGKHREPPLPDVRKWSAKRCIHRYFGVRTSAGKPDAPVSHSTVQTLPGRAKNRKIGSVYRSFLSARAGGLCHIPETYDCTICHKSVLS